MALTYHRLARLGMLEPPLGGPAAWRERALGRPVALMHAAMPVWWWSSERIADWEACSADPPFSERSYVPFADDSEGRWWSWIPTAGSQPAVGLVRQDDGGGVYVAPSFDGMVFRLLLESMAAADAGRYGLDPPDLARSLRAEVELIAPLLPGRRAAILRSVAVRPQVQTRADAWGFITEQLAESILAEELGDAYVNGPILGPER